MVIAYFICTHDLLWADKHCADFDAACQEYARFKLLLIPSLFVQMAFISIATSDWDRSPKQNFYV